MDLTQSIAPKSDQLNADDLITGPVTVTIVDVAKGSLEQPININLAEYPGRAYRPSKSMRRVMVASWGADGTKYAGNRLTLFRNPDITFGKEKVGGIEISHLSGIDAPLAIPLTTTRGHRRTYTVDPLFERDWDAELKLAGNNVEAVKALGTAARAAGSPAVDIILAKYNELKSCAQEKVS